MATALSDPNAPAAPPVAAGEDDPIRRRGARATFGRTERLRGLVFDLLAGTPPGLTADEVAAALDESVLAVRPRVSELFHAGLIAKTGERRLNRSGLRAHVWKKQTAAGD